MIINTTNNSSIKTKLKAHHNPSDQSKRADSFFNNFEEVLARNDIEAAQKLAHRIKLQIIPIGENNLRTSSPLQISMFHQKIIDRLNTDISQAAAAMRKELASVYFKAPGRSLNSNHEVNWFNEQEMEEIGGSQHSRAYYYHATKLKGLKGILQTGRVKALRSGYYGAFVSVGQPFFYYGDYALAFNKNIERNSPVSTHVHPDAVGFLRNIPINQKTLNCVLLNDDIDRSNPTLKVYALKSARQGLLQYHPSRITNAIHREIFLATKSRELFREWVRTKCKKWAGRDIPVIYESEAISSIDKIRAVNLGIPKEWGQDGYSDLRPSSKPIPSRSIFLPSRL